MGLLALVKSVINSIFDYYLNFDRGNLKRLFGSGLLITLVSFLAFFAFNYFSHILSPTIHDSVPFNQSNYRKFLILIVENRNVYTGLTLLNLALLAPHFMSMTRNKADLSLVETIRNISPKKWGFYLSFVIITLLFSLYPSPFYEDYGPFTSALNLSVSGISSLGIWLFNIFQLLSYISVIVFAIILAQKEKIKFSELIKERWNITAIVLVIAAIEILYNTFSGAMDLYLGDLFILLDSKNIFGLIIGVIKLTVLIYLIPIKISALSFQTLRQVKPEVKTVKENHEILDDEI